MNEPNGEPLDEQAERDLAALADGSLDSARREQVEARVAGSPRLQALLAEQRSALAAIARDDRAPVGFNPDRQRAPTVAAAGTPSAGARAGGDPPWSRWP